MSTVLSLLIGAGILVFGIAASAQTKAAMVNIVYKNQFLPGGPTFSIRSGSGVATVQTGVATPSVMWPASLVSGATSSTYAGPGYTGLRVETFMDQAATVVGNHPNQAPAGGSTLIAQTNIPQTVTTPTPMVATTLCFKTIMFTPAAPAPGSCASRFGTMKRTPGTKKYGGTARILVTGGSSGKFGLNRFSLRNFITPNYSLLPSAVGNYAQAGSAKYTNTVTGGTFVANQHGTRLPLTTGMVNVTQTFGDYVTILVGTGSANFTTTNLMGTLSLVRPVVVQTFGQVAGAYAGTFTALGGIQTVEVTFLPAPGVMISTACGLLALAGLWQFRRHRDKG